MDEQDARLDIRVSANENPQENRSNNLTPTNRYTASIIMELIKYINLLLIIIIRLWKKGENNGPDSMKSLFRVGLCLVSVAYCLFLDVTDLLIYERVRYVHLPPKNRKINEFTKEECRLTFRFTQEQLYILLNGIALPDQLRSENGFIFSKVICFIFFIIEITKLF